VRPEHREWIKKCVFEHLAPAHNGKIMMAEIQRLFSDDGSYQELKQVLDEFVRDNQARPIEEAGDMGYVFPAIARRIGEGVIKEFKEKERTAEKIRTEIQTRNRLVESLEEISSLWQLGWERLLKDPGRRATVTNYISSFWRERQESLLAEVAAETNRLTAVENEIAALKRRMDESYAG
jgi:hypothetical protein